MAHGRTIQGGTYRGQTAPKRAKCPRCGKKGLGPWKPYPNPVEPCHLRDCRYCQLTQVGKMNDEGAVTVTKEH